MTMLNFNGFVSQEASLTFTILYLCSQCPSDASSLYCRCQPNAGCI